MGPSSLRSFVDTARDLGYRYLCANDHLVYQRPWLDGIVALSSVVHDSGDMQLVTSVSPPVVRGPVTLAKAAGIGRVFLWPLAEPQAQLDRVMSTVVPVLDAG